MINRISVFISDSTNVHYNLAIEEYLAESVKDDECILYLWQNEKTVVIGRNQNAWRECRTEDLSNEGGLLARRLSGGGAVYQDLGNLNFTFCLKTENNDIRLQQSVIIEACKYFGINAEISGRNDLLVDGKKFSGNSFCTRNGYTFHNGTLLIDADKNLMEKYLTPSKLKFAGKGIESVRSRTVNLKTICPELTVEKLSNAIVLSFEKVYNLKSNKISELDDCKINELYGKFSSYDWNFGKTLAFTFSIEERFNWGVLTIELKVNQGICEDACVWTDALDTNFAQDLKKCFIGKHFTKEELINSVKSIKECETAVTDVCKMIESADI